MIRGAVHHMLERRRERRALGSAAPPPRKGLWSLRGGIGTLGRAAARTLGTRLRAGCPVRSIDRDGDAWRVETEDGPERARHLVVAVPPGRAAALVGGELGTLLAGVRLAPLAVVHLGFERRLEEIEDAFGFLIPRGEGIRTLGVLFPGRMFEDRAGGGDLLTGYVGGMLDPGALELADDELLSTVRADLEGLTGLDRDPDHVRVLRYPAAIPQLEHGHLARMRAVHAAIQDLPHLHLAGNYLRGVGLKDAVASGMAAAARVAGETR
jgi:oxygen-dependent protoporphyrinogen oxidase